MKKLSLYELIEAVMKAENDLVSRIADTDKANRAYQEAYVSGAVAKNKAAKANAAAKAEDEAREELADLRLELDAAFAAAAEEEEDDSNFEAMLEEARAEVKAKKIITKTDREKERKELDPAAYEAKCFKEAEKARRQEEAAEVRARSKKKAEGILYLRKSGVWARREAKSAKESARWLRMLMDIEESRKPILNIIKPIPEKSQEEVRADLAVWRKRLEYRKDFNAKEHYDEMLRRMINNAKASEFLGHPAMESAKVFSEDFIAVEGLLGKPFDELAEMGCKALFEEINKYNGAVSDLEDRLEEDREQVKYMLNDILDENPWSYDALMGTVREEYKPRMRKLIRQIAELKAERKLIRRAVETAKEYASDADKALIEAREEIVLKKAKSRKQIEGRTYVPLAKPEMKGYKNMSFMDIAVLPEKLRKHIRELTRAALEWKKCTEDDSSDDDIAKARADVQAKFRKVVDVAFAMVESCEPIVMDSSKAHINDNRQSELADVIKVPYGTLTDMIISVDHNMANLLPFVVKEALSDDPAKAQRNIDGLETVIMDIFTKNGITVKFHNKEGEREVHYEFWNANNSALKVGKFYALSDGAFAIAKEAAQMGMTDEEFEEIPTNGSDMLKNWSYATTPGCPIEGVTVNDVLVVDSIDIERVFGPVKEFVENKENGKVYGILKKEAKVPRTAYDGQLFFMVPIPSQQVRGGMCFKGYGVCCAYEDGTTIVDEIARREGRKIPEYIRDIDGMMRRWRDYKVICTKDAWKWAGWGISYAEFCERMNKLAEKNPAVNKLYTARIADATEESKRRMTRQSLQQMLFATDKQIDDLIKKSVSKIQKLRTPAGVIRKLAGLDKPEEERTAFEHLIEAAPEILNHPLMRKYVEDVFNREVAEAAARPEVDGIYPYIAEDPVAFFKIVLWGENPNKLGLGYLEAHQVNIPGAGEGKKMYLVRYPNNYLCGMIGYNHNDDIYRCVGNTMILSLDGYWLIRADGDVDGDEMCAVFNECIIEMMEKTIKYINPPLIVFPHQKLAKTVIRGKEARAKAIATAIVIANKFGPAVGQNSNLATKFMHRAGMARMEIGYAIKAGDKEAERKARFKMDSALDDAIIAHIAAIIAIDLAKTGKMPAWLEEKLNEISVYGGKNMPWNQRFAKDNTAFPWNGKWETRDEEKAPCDRIARAVVNKTDAYNYVSPMQEDFDMMSILCKRDGLCTKGSKGKLKGDLMKRVDGRNYLRKNKDGIDECRIIEKLHSADENDTVSPTKLMLYFWRNQASLMYRLHDSDEERIERSNVIDAYIRLVRDVMLRFGSYCGSDKFMALSPENQEKSNVYAMMNYAFSDNQAGENDITKAATESAKAKFAIFTVKVFAYDLYRMVCDNKGISNVWTMPELKCYETAPCPVDDGYEEEMEDWMAGCA